MFKLRKEIKACLLIAWMPSAIFALFVGGMIGSYSCGLITFLVCYLGAISIVQGLIILDIDIY